MYRILRHIFPLVFLCLNADHAIAQMTGGCDTELERAAVLLSDGDYEHSRILLDTLIQRCTGDRDLRHRILLLQAATYHELDSLAGMRRSLELMFRNDRHMPIKPYEKEIKDKELVFTTWDEEIRYELRKDHGRFRVGMHLGPRFPLLQTEGERKVFESDEPYDHSTLTGFEAGVHGEFEVLHNSSIHISVSRSTNGYTARNDAIRYEETLTAFPMTASLKRSFWISPRSPWVPWITAGVTYTPITTAKVSIERAGDGVRFLAPKTYDRIAERNADQLLLAGSIGLARKVGHTVLFVEGRYEHALTDLTLDSPSYTETELLTRYYYVDNRAIMHGIIARFGVQYIVKYHSHNRIHR